MAFKNARIKAHLTQQEAAEKIGVHQTAIAAWETGRARPRTAKLIKVCEIYGYTLEELLSPETSTEAAAV